MSKRPWWQKLFDWMSGFLGGDPQQGPTLVAINVTSTTADLKWTPANATVTEVGRSGVDSNGGGPWNGVPADLPFLHLIPDTNYALHAVINGTRVDVAIRTLAEPVHDKTVHAAAWLTKPDGLWWFSPTFSEADKVAYLSKCKTWGMEAFNFLATSSNGRIEYTHAQRDAWRAGLQRIKDNGQKLIVCWFMDDESSYNGKPDSWWIAYYNLIHDDLGDLIDEYVHALECNEYLKVDRSRKLIAHIKSITGKPCGGHTTPGTGGVGHIAGADSWHYQCWQPSQGASKSTSDMTNAMRAAAKVWPGTIIAEEYYLGCEAQKAADLGDAAIAAGADGVGQRCGPEGIKMLRARLP